MSNSLAATSEGRGSRPSPRWVLPLIIVAIAAVVGLAVGRFATYSDTARVDLPTVVVPPDDEVLALQADAEANPQSPRAWQELGINATRQAIVTADPAWYAIAGDAYDRAEELDPTNDFLTIARGQLTLSLHDFDKALDLGQRATTVLPSTADGWGVLVDAQVELGMYEEAADSLQTMLDLRPDLSALARASYLRQLNGDLDGAIVAMRQAEVAGGGAFGQTSIISGLLGDLLLQRGDLDDAEAAYLRAQSGQAAAGLARIDIARGDLDRAEVILTQVSRQTPFPAVITALAEVQTRQGDQEGLADTVELGRTIATLQQANGQTVDLELALFEASYGDPARAIELARQAYDARPDNVFAAGALAWSLFKDGQQEQALEFADQATRLGTVDTAHELRIALITGQGLDQLLARNPLAEELFLP
ncbi:MAG: tetratricopeptide repeat protein [Euzebya sp.]